MVEGRKIAILVKGSAQIEELPGILQSFERYFQYIQVFVICGAQTDAKAVSQATIDRFSDCEAACFADDVASARRYGFRYTTIEEMAPMLRVFDAVIPI